MHRIREIMTPHVFTLSASLGVPQAAWALTRHGIGGAPVLDEDGQMIGVVSKGDLVDLAMASAGVEDATVRDVMTPAIVSLAPDDSLVDAIELMVGHGIHRLVVVDDDGHAVGIVTALDVLRTLVSPPSVVEAERLREIDEDAELQARASAQ